MLISAINISEGRRSEVIATIAGAAGADLGDVHSDVWHNRSVITVRGEEAPRSVASATLELLDIRAHRGAHPRMGVLDVVPFVAHGSVTMDEAVGARDRFAGWVSAEHHLPCFLYGPERTLPEVRRQAFGELDPDFGPGHPHPTAGVCAVGARPPLVAYNLWLEEGSTLELARRTARAMRSGEIRALGLQLGDRVQVSLNLLEPETAGPAEAYDRVAALAPIARAELVGLIPEAVRERIPRDRWASLDIEGDVTIEARFNEPGLD